MSQRVKLGSKYNYMGTKWVKVGLSGVKVGLSGVEVGLTGIKKGQIGVKVQGSKIKSNLHERNSSHLITKHFTPQDG